MSSASDRRKSSGGDEGGGANWMDTYGDLVTLLLTFFVLLFSMSSIDVAKWQALVGSFTGISVIAIDPISPAVAVANPIPIIGPQPAAEGEDAAEQGTDPDVSTDPDETAEGQVEQNAHEMYGILNEYVMVTGIAAEVYLDEDMYLVRIVFNEQVFFETASAVVRPDAYPVLDSIVDMFRSVEHLYTMLIVEGHADSRPISTQQYPSNWHLSAYRATNVCGYIRMVGGLDPRRLQIAGYGEEQPVAPNDTAENMAKNRRVEFIAEAGDPRRITRNIGD